MWPRSPEEKARLQELNAVNTGPKTKTVQDAKDDCDINVLVRRFRIGEGEMPMAMMDPAEYGDATLRPQSMRELLDIAVSTREKFMALPADLRKRFRNDPSIFHEAVHNPERVDEMVKLGVLQRRKEAPPPVIPEIRLADETIEKMSKRVGRLDKDRE